VAPALLTAVAAGGPPPATSAGCGGVVSTGARNWYHAYRPPLAIGDSTMLLALPALARKGFSVNAHGCRQYPEALALLSSLRHAHELPRVVVIALGSNGEIRDGDVSRALEILGANRVLALVTPRELGGGAGADAQLVRAEARRHPTRVRVLDWVNYSAGHPDWLEPDGLHVSPAGSAAQVRLLARVLPLDAAPRSVASPSCPVPAPGAQMPRTGVGLAPPGGVLDVHRSASRLKLTLINSNAVPISGLARLREALPDAPTIAARCFSAAGQARTTLLLTLPLRALAELDLRGQYRVRLELVLGAAQGPSETLTSTYLLKHLSR
jgi:hypothetical protein